MNNDISQLKNVGFVHFKEKISKPQIEILKTNFCSSFDKHYQIQLNNKVENPNRWLALNALCDNENYINFIENFVFDLNFYAFFEEYFEEYFEGNFILNSFSLLNAVNDDINFSSNIHRDSKFFLNELPLMLNVITNWRTR